MARPEIEGLTMIDAAEAFAGAIAASASFKRWESARKNATEDQELSTAVERLAELSSQFGDARARGAGMPGPELEEMIRLQAVVQESPLAREHEAAAQALMQFLQEANGVVSELLGIDFAANAARRGGGCCG